MNMTMQEPVTRTTCPYCGVGCGLLVSPDGAGGTKVVADPAHPANLGRICVKGAALAETLDLKGRLLAPRISGRDASWDQALSLVADRFASTIRRHGPDAVAMYVSGQMLTEDYYAANKLMKGFIGSANIDSNSRLCMASSVAGHKRAFGSDTVPGCYEDLELADTVVLVGSNLAWCHPVLFQRLAAARQARGTKVIVIDPRRTATCEIADLHLALAPGSDAALFNLLLAEISRRGQVDPHYARNLEGLEEAVASAAATPASLTGLAHSQIRKFLTTWLSSDKVVTVYSQGINQSTSGTDKVNAILNCHLATGRIGRPGAGPFSVTGQPNAMGGREVGGLANMLGCHLDIGSPQHRDAVAEFWNAPNMISGAGLKAADMFRAVGSGQIKALWVVGSNPAASMPEAGRIRQAMRECDFLVVSDIIASTDTAKLADVLLPATGWGEKDGTVTNSERRISRQRRFLPAPGLARDDWRIIAEIGQRMGWPEAFAWRSPAEIFSEHAALSGLAASMGSDFDISGFAGQSSAQYDALDPFQWPKSAHRNGGRFFADGRFNTPSRKANLVAVTADVPAQALAEPSYMLNTGRVRDHWHTMTRSGKSARLSRHLAEPYLELHPDDARALGVGPAELARVSNLHGSAILRVLISDRVRRGHPFAPIHWTAQTASAGRVGDLVESCTDPLSGQPALKSARVTIAPFRPAWYGYAITSGGISPDCEYWVRATVPGGVQAELAGISAPDCWETAAGTMFGIQREPLVMRDDSAGIVRLAYMRGTELLAALFIAPEPVALSRSHVSAALDRPFSAEILAGHAGTAQADNGAIICACLGVGLNRIRDAISNGGLDSVEAIGDALGAGTGCGSCRPELKALLRDRQAVAAL